MVTVNDSEPTPDSEQQAAQLDQFLGRIRPLLCKFIASADQRRSSEWKSDPELGYVGSPSTAFDHADPATLTKQLDLKLPKEGQNEDGIIALIGRLLKNSVNTWHQGFLDKLYGSTDPIGVVAEAVLATLNTNVHVYKVAPALTSIEKTLTRSLAKLFGLCGPNAGGISQPGGSGANLTALVVARNCMFPETKADGCAGKKLVLFTSTHGHYSFEKAAQVCGLGSDAVLSVSVDEEGRMRPEELRRLILQQRARGHTPFFVNATAGTTVLGSYDQLDLIGQICQDEGLWFHVDGSWGGSVVFSDEQQHKLQGAELAHTITVNPHKMLGVPITCSFLLSRDTRDLHRANTLPAGYLFHTPEAGAADGREFQEEVWDLADLTLQCGRKGDALKMALAWEWYGSNGFARRIDHAFEVTRYLASLVDITEDLVLASNDPPPCLQVCFYYAPGRKLATREENDAHTRRIANGLLKRDFLVDYAPGPRGLFFRVVVSLNTRNETVQRLVSTVVEIGRCGR